jgi:hypothetical protein
MGRGTADQHSFWKRKRAMKSFNTPGKAHNKLDQFRLLCKRGFRLVFHDYFVSSATVEVTNEFHNNDDLASLCSSVCFLDNAPKKKPFASVVKTQICCDYKLPVRVFDFDVEECLRNQKHAELAAFAGAVSELGLTSAIDELSTAKKSLGDPAHYEHAMDIAAELGDWLNYRYNRTPSPLICY